LLAKEASCLLTLPSSLHIDIAAVLPGEITYEAATTRTALLPLLGLKQLGEIRTEHRLNCSVQSKIELADAF
jgi:hypothetical protein